MQEHQFEQVHILIKNKTLSEVIHIRLPAAEVHNLHLFQPVQP